MYVHTGLAFKPHPVPAESKLQIMSGQSVTDFLVELVGYWRADQ